MKRLTREELLSEEQFTKLSALDDLTDLEEVADIVKDTKVGQRLKCLAQNVRWFTQKLAIITRRT